MTNKKISINDCLVRGSIKTPAVRFAFANTTSLCHEGIILNDADPIGASIFSEALTTGALLAVLLNEEEKYSLRFEYDGKVGGIIVEVKSDSSVRGNISQAHLAETGGDIDVIFGKEEAVLAFVKSANGKILNSGMAKCGMASPAADASMFFSISDQIETEIVTQIQFNPDPENPVKTAVGFMIQAMPGCDLKNFEEIRTKLQSIEFKDLLLDQKLPFEQKIRNLIALLGCQLEDKNTIYELCTPPHFNCSCTFESMRRAMLTLGKEELEKLFNEITNPSVTCGFCHSTYIFKKEELL